MNQTLKDWRISSSALFLASSLFAFLKEPLDLSISFKNESKLMRPIE